MKEVELVVRSMRNVDLNTEITIKFTINFSHNKKIRDDKQLCRILTKIQLLLKHWKSRIVILQIKIVIFETLKLLKIIFQS